MIKYTCYLLPLDIHNGNGKGYAFPGEEQRPRSAFTANRQAAAGGGLQDAVDQGSPRECNSGKEGGNP